MKHDYNESCICLDCHKIWANDQINNLQETLFDMDIEESDF